MEIAFVDGLRWLWKGEQMNMILTFWLNPVTASLSEPVGDKLPRHATGSIKPSLLILRVAVVEKRAAVPDQIKQVSFNGHSSPMKRFVEIAHDLPAQHPQAVDVFLDGLCQKIRSGQRCQKKSEHSRKFDENEAKSL